MKPLEKEKAATGCLYSFVLMVVIITIVSIFATSCAAPEQLTECSPKDRYIIDRSEKWLIVTDGCGRPAQRIPAKNFPEAKIGGWLLCYDYLRVTE